MNQSQVSLSSAFKLAVSRDQVSGRVLIKLYCSYHPSCKLFKGGLYLYLPFPKRDSYDPPLGFRCS